MAVPGEGNDQGRGHSFSLVAAGPFALRPFAALRLAPPSPFTRAQTPCLEPDMSCLEP